MPAPQTPATVRAVAHKDKIRLLARSDRSTRLDSTLALPCPALPLSFPSAPLGLSAVATTNLGGTLLCSRAAVVLFEKQRGGNLFLTLGAGSDGGGTPLYAAYGSTKAAIKQLAASLQSECKDSGSRVGVHLVSPGMVLTDLLLEGATPQGKAAFNALCEQPETVAAELVPKVRRVRGSGVQLDYLTAGRAVLRLLSLPFVQGRFFDGAGKATFRPEAERIAALCEERRTRRLRTADASSAMAAIGREHKGAAAGMAVAAQRAWAAALEAESEVIGLGFAYSAALASAFVVLAKPY